MDDVPPQAAAARLAVEEFLIHEALLLDERRWTEWLALFEPEGRYWMPLAWGQASHVDHVSLINEDTDLLRARTDRAEHKRTAAQWPSSRTLRQIGNVFIEGRTDVEIRVRSALTFAEYRRNELHLYAAVVRHILVEGASGYRIRLKRVDLLNCDADIGHLRLAVPF